WHSPCAPPRGGILRAMVRCLAFSGPLEWEPMLAYFRARAIPGVELVAGNAYRRTVVLDGHPTVLELVRGGADHLLLRGGPVPGELRRHGLTHTFPAAHVVATADLSRADVPRARADAIKAFAQAVAEREVQLDGTMTLDELTAAITAIRGLGPWTAQYIALRL